MAVNTPPASPNSGDKGKESTENGDTRKGRSPERRDNKGDKSTSPSNSSSTTGKGSIHLPSNDTNSTDPESVRCRVFVGNLNTDKIGQEELLIHFSEFGEVTGCSLHANFGFVQYAKKEDADTAVTKTHGTFLFGKRVDVNIASDRRKPQAKDRKKGDEPVGRPRRRSRSRSQERYRSRSPMSRYDDLYRRDDPYGRGDRNNPRDFYDDRRDDYYDSQEPYVRPSESFAREAPTSSKTADCEVIAMSGDLKDYADSIQSRLHAMGITANIMFPPPDVSVLRIVDNISKSGSLYAVVITSQNMYHKSCTLNILHGAPQEHRNMPLDDALAFVARNFNQYLNDSRYRRPAPLQGPAVPNRGEPMGKTILTQDSYISGLLNMAAGGMALKVVEVNHLIEALIKYKNDIESSNVVDTSVPPDSAALSSLRPGQSHHPGTSSSSLKDPPANLAAGNQSYYASQPPTAQFSYSSSSSASSNYPNYRDYESTKSNAAGPAASYSAAMGQQSTGYPSSTYSQQISSYPNYYD